MAIKSFVKCFKLLIIMCSMTWISITITNKYLNKINDKMRPIGKRSPIKLLLQNERTYIILFWTKYFDLSIESHINKSLSQMKCLSTNCAVTSDRAYLPFSNAIIFHWRDIDIEDMPAIRRSDQLWTLHNLEAPTYTRFLPDHNLYFNITSSYRTDSDIYVPYGRIVKTNQTINHSINEMNFNNKSKLIFWFVSNCVTPGKRELYVQELNRFIPIDIYGKCGQYSCDPPRSQQCFRKIAKNYKFYLSFENSICRDYVTEKLFEALNYDIVPVVFGGSHYRSFMPKHSFIDANQFTPKHLAQHLIEIASNEQKYLSYFKWKQEYSVESGFDSEFKVFCKLCQILNSHKTYSSHSSDQIIEWWFRKANCKTWTNKH